jgi:hypothetical protein
MSDFGFWIFLLAMIVLFYGDPSVLELLHAHLAKP